MPAASTASQARTVRKAPGQASNAKSALKSTPNGYAASLPSMPSGAQNLSAYQIMAHRIANRVAEMAETYTFVERYVPNKTQNFISI
jgi:hypothetical protein